MSDNFPQQWVEDEDERAARLRRQRFVRFIPVIFWLIAVLSFWSPIRDILATFWNVSFSLIFGFNQIEVSGSLGRSFGIGFLNFVVSFGMMFYVWLWVLCYQALVPVNNLQDIYRLTYLMLRRIFGFRGPAVFISDGQIMVEPNELDRTGPGLIVVDFNSAVVLEEIILPPGLRTSLSKLGLRLLETIGLQDRFESPRVHGAGVVFIRPWERIRGVVDLRTQYRNIENQPVSEEPDETSAISDPDTSSSELTGALYGSRISPIASLHRLNKRRNNHQQSDSSKNVYGYTRDGIEVATKLNVTFTIGRRPDVLDFAYIGEELPENLRVVTLENLADNRVRIKQIESEFEKEPEEVQEVHRYAPGALRSGKVTEYEPVTPPALPPVYYPNRVFSAVFAQARSLQSRGPDDRFVPWTDLPRRVAIDFYREELSEVNYDDLFLIGQDLPLPLNHLRKKVRCRVRNNGMLFYRILGNCTAIPFNVGEEYATSQIVVTTARPFTTPRLLRERGISMIHCGFSDLTPSDAIYHMRLEAWRANWQRDTEIGRAREDLQAMREHARARADAQRDLIHTLTIILNNKQASDEALSIRIFQALENLAAEPQTQALLPPETLQFMRSAHDWLLPDEENKNNRAYYGGSR